MYTEKDVEQLKWIKVLRYLDFSIEDIRQFFGDEESRQTALLQEKAEQIEEQKDDLQTKKNLCATLAKDIKADSQIIDEYIDLLLLNALFALLGTVLLTWNWIHYITAYRQNKNRVKKSNRKHNWIPLALPLVIIAGIAAVIGVNILVEKLLAPKDFLFYEFQPIADLVLVKLDIPKTASSEGWKNCDYDKQYVDRFLRIIQN